MFELSVIPATLIFRLQFQLRGNKIKSQYISFISFRLLSITEIISWTCSKLSRLSTKPVFSSFRYLRRFRNDPPLRREDRKAPSLSEFWWGSKSGNNNHGDQDKCSRRHDYGSYHATDRLKYHRDVGNNRADISSTKATENTCSERDFTVSSDTTPRSTNSSHKVRVVNLK